MGSEMCIRDRGKVKSARTMNERRVGGSPGVGFRFSRSLSPEECMFFPRSFVFVGTGGGGKTLKLLGPDDD